MRKVVLTVELETCLSLKSLRKIIGIEFADRGGSSYVYSDEKADGCTYGQVKQVQANVVKND